MNGVVKWFNARKGYGFITPEGADADDPDSQNDILVHFSSSQMDGFKTLYQGDEVTFDTEQGGKGLEAKNVVVTKRAERPPRRGGGGRNRQ